MLPYSTFSHFLQTIAFAPFEDISYKTVRRTLEVYKNATKIGVIFGDNLYLFVSKLNKDYYTHAQSHPYVFVKRSGKEVQTHFWSVPHEIIAKPKDFGQWVGDSYRAATKRFS